MINKSSAKISGMILICILFLNFLLPGLSLHTVESAEISPSLTIKKYVMTDDQSHSLENQGLAPLSGAQYLVERVVPTTEQTGRTDWQPNHYVKPAASLLFQKTITTDENGVATLSAADGLVSGYYLITETKSDRIPNPMKPVVVSLPMEGPDGKSLINDVVVYPKSGVITPEPPTEPTPPNTSNVPPVTEIPQTSGRLAGQWSLIGIFLVILGFGLVQFFVVKRQKKSQSKLS